MTRTAIEQLETEGDKKAMNNRSRTITAHFALTAALLLSPLAASAAEDKPAAKPTPAIELGAPFGDNMILQRDMDVPVWGWSKPGTMVTVEFAGQKESAKAGADGKWLLRLKPLKASAKPAEMVINDSDGKRVVLKNVLVGEVWMASGQSNMQWAAGKCDVAKLLARIEEAVKAGTEKPPVIREFEVTSVYSALHPIERATGAWKDGGMETYSAIATAFACELYKELGVPIGILNCSFSQTAIEAWVPRAGYAAAEADYGREINRKCLVTDPRTPEHKEAWSAFYKSLEDQIAASEAMIKKGEKPPAISAPVPGNMNDNRDANWMFNGRLNPVVPFAIRGAIWNQGWANRGSGLLYYNSLHDMIRGWRLVWDKPDLPVYFHQFYCPGGGVFSGKPSLDTTAEMRLGTLLARDIPNAGMACQIDIQGAIHYGNKTLPGKRLALHALKNQYGKKIVADGPMFKSYEVKGDKLTVAFDFADGGIQVGQAMFDNLLDAPAVLTNSEDKVKLFYLAGEDKVWHQAAMKIEGEKIVVSSPDVKAPRGVAYGTGGVGSQPSLYNKALLPLAPFIYYDNKLVTSKDWPDGRLKVAGETIDPSSVGNVYEYRKMPLLSQQFEDNAVLQAGKPVTIWGSTRKFGEWQAEPEKGDCKVDFEFGDIKKTISVTPDMKEWQVTLPPMKAGATPYTLKAHFTINGEVVHDRVATNIVFGDVWYVGAPAGKFNVPEIKPSGQIVRMIANESMREGTGAPWRFSVATSRAKRRNDNRFASYWKDATGLAAALGHGIAAKTGQPVGIIFMQSKSDVALKNWIAADFLNQTPSLMADYKTVGSQYPYNPYYLENVRRYIADWRNYWGKYIPEMIETKAVPDAASWGWYPSPAPKIGDSQATWTYNVYVDCFAPAQLSGIVFLCGKAMAEEEQGAKFGPELSVLANCLKTKFNTGDVPFLYTIPSSALAPKITKPQAIKGRSVAVEINNWPNPKAPDTNDWSALIEKVMGEVYK
jgi:sialate O-acetylesterase